MLPYYLLTLIPIFFYFIRISITASITTNISNIILKEKNDSRTIGVFFLILFLILALRNNSVGADLAGYELHYFASGKMNLHQLIQYYGFESGYYFICHIFAKIGVSFRLFIVFLSFITCLTLYIFYKNESGNSLLTLSIFVVVSPFSMLFSGLRQVCAMLLSLLAYEAIKNKKIIKCIIYILLAFIFHNSAAIVFLLIPLRLIKFGKKSLWYLIPSGILMFAFRKFIFIFLLTFSSKYEHYTSRIEETGAFGIFAILLMFTIFTFVVTNSEQSDFIFARNVLVLATFIQMFASINSIAMRVNYYFLLIVPIALPLAIQRRKASYKYICVIATIVIICFLNFYFIYKGYTSVDILHIYPYIPFWRAE